MEITVKRVVLTTFFTILAIPLALFSLDFYVTHQAELDMSIRHLLSVTYESSIGNWYSTVLTFCVAMVLWVTYLKIRAENRGQVPKSVWLMLALAFTFFSIDDGSRLHEQVSPVISDAFALSGTASSNAGLLARLFDWFPGYSWHIVFVPLLVAVTLLLLYVVFYEFRDRWCRIMLIIGLACFVSGVGIDFMEGASRNNEISAFSFMAESNPYMRHYLKVIEECIEMTGMGLCLCAFLRHLLLRFNRWEFQFKA